MRSSALFAAAIILFGISLLLPAITPDMGTWSSSTIPGWYLAIVAWPFYVSNVALLLSPLLVLLFKRLKSARTALIALAGFYVATPAATVFFGDEILHLGIGAFFWAGSFLAAALGVFGTLPTKQPEDEPLKATADLNSPTIQQ